MKIYVGESRSSLNFGDLVIAKDEWGGEFYFLFGYTKNDSYTLTDLESGEVSEIDITMECDDAIDFMLSRKDLEFFKSIDGANLELKTTD